MRKALGLLGEPPRHRPQAERTETPARLPERVGTSGLHRRRFVQDGDVPVTVLRREPGQDTAANRVGSVTLVPTSGRLQQVEAALATETAARAQAERALAEAQAALRDLQTKIGHADLAKNEAHAALQRERDVVAGLRQELEAARAEAEAARLRAAEAKRRLRTLAEEASEPVAQASHAKAPIVATAKKRGRQAIVHQPTLPQLEAAPKPVKWWLMPPKRASRC